MDIVLIPCWRRDDFLSVTIDHILKANNNDHLYIFSLDRGFDISVLNVIKKFPLNKVIRKTPNHKYNGNSYNVLEGYKYAIELSKQYQSNLIYMIEEDIWIGKDFFSFHETVQNNFKSFCVSAVYNQNIDIQLENNPEYIYYHNAFQSLGLSWKIENLEKIVRYATDLYYKDMSFYLKSTFPNSKYQHMWPEQDGLINRVIEQNNEKCIFPYVGRAYHAGFIGYNRPGKSLTGNLDERCEKLKNMTDQEMNERADIYKDIKSISLSGYNIKQFTLKEW